VVRTSELTTRARLARRADPGTRDASENGQTTQVSPRSWRLVLMSDKSKQPDTNDNTTPDDQLEQVSGGNLEPIPGCIPPLTTYPTKPIWPDDTSPIILFPN
jgi:hypothetical protein